MEPYDRFREKFTSASAEEKLMIIRSESMRILGLVVGYATLMHQIVEERTPSEFPDDFKDWCKKVADGSHEMRDLIDALTDPRHRTLLEQERANQKRRFNEEQWKYTQARVPELQQYESFAQAVEQTAEKLGLSLTEGPTEKIEVDAPFHPDGYLAFSTRERRADIGAQFSQRDGRVHLGYVITLQWCSDKRNLKWQEHEGLTQSLAEAVIALSRWLVENWDLERIKQEYPWLNSGTVQRFV